VSRYDNGAGRRLLHFNNRGTMSLLPPKPLTAYDLFVHLRHTRYRRRHSQYPAIGVL
jgi:hypothetical protein